MTFYLQTGIPDNKAGWREERTFIDDRLHSECVCEKTCEADSWLEARSLLWE